MNEREIIGRIVKGIQDFAGDKHIIVGMSGGVDSSVVTALCVKALGKKKVLGILLPYGEQDMTDAKKLAVSLGVPHKIIDIKSVVDNLTYVIPFGLTHRVVGNIKSRIRMVILYALANDFDGFVAGTSNKTEIELGYFTKYGDGGVDFEPIGDLYKFEVYKIAESLGIPDKIIKKAPSAGLWEGQTDEEEIGMTYNQIDSLLLMKEKTEHKRKMPDVVKVK